MFKKIIQIAWILIAVAFLVLMALKIKSDSTVVYRTEKTKRTSMFHKVNKLTGSMQVREAGFFTMTKWKTPEELKDEE